MVDDNDLQFLGAVAPLAGAIGGVGYGAYQLAKRRFSGEQVVPLPKRFASAQSFARPITSYFAPVSGAIGRTSRRGGLYLTQRSVRRAVSSFSRKRYSRRYRRVAPAGAYRPYKLKQFSRRSRTRY